MKFHSVMFQAGKTYAISMKSSDFDSYLVLESPKGEVVAEDDDATFRTPSFTVENVASRDD